MESIPVDAVMAIANGAAFVVPRTTLMEIQSALYAAAEESDYSGTTRRLLALADRIDEVMGS